MTSEDNVISIHGRSDLEAIDGNLERAENELRARTRELYKQIETTYWDLGQALFDVYDGIPGGYRALLKGEAAKETRRGLFAKWGYSSFEEYCEREVGLMRRSASNLRYAYWWFEHELKLPGEIKDRLKKLGRSKLYAMAGFVGNDNVVSWIEKAEGMTTEELKKAIKSAKALHSKSSSEDNQNEGDFSEETDRARRESTSSADPREAPAPEVMHTVSTSLYDGQWKTWQLALERAKGVTNSDKISHNLEMICLDYLSTNDFMDPADDLKVYLSKLEKMIGVKLIAIDPKNGKPKYGTELLWAMVNSRSEDTASSVDSVVPEPQEEDSSSNKKKTKVKREDVKAEDKQSAPLLTVVPDEEPPPAF